MLLATGVTVAQNRSAPIEFGNGGISTSIGRQLVVLTDSTGNLSPEQALVADGYVPSDQDVPNLQVTSAAYWLRFTIRNGSAGNVLVLSVPYAEIDEVDLFTVEQGGLERIAHTGRSREWRERTPEGAEYTFEITVPIGGEQEYLIRVRGFKPIHVPIHLDTPSRSAWKRMGHSAFLGSYAGIMLVMALYNLFVFLSIRDRSYLYYVLYILAICSAQLTFLGAGPLQTLELPAWFESRSSIFFALLAIVLGMEFARRFIGTKDTVPRMHKFVPMFFVLIVVNLVIYSAFDPAIGYQLAQAMGGLSAIYLLIMASLAWRRGSRQAGFFLLAWVAFLVGVVVFVLKDAGVLAFTTLTQYAMPIGSAIEGVLLSFGLADRINILRKEKEASQAEALNASRENERIIREQNMLLEDKVQQRTHALQESNEHLKRTQTQLVNAEKMASLGQLTAGIAHEINNPINFITSNIAPLRRNIGEIVEVMQGYRSVDAQNAAVQIKALKEQEEKLGLQESIDELDSIIESIAEGSSRTAEIVRGLRNFSRLDQDDLKESDLNEGLRSTLAVLAPQFRDRVRMDVQLGEVPRVECFPGKVNQVFMNILTNAVQATLIRTGDVPGVIRVTTSLLNDHVVVSIKDNGIGMSDEVKARMYDPFFTTKPVGEGTGLGLAIVYGIIEDHQGNITVDSIVGQGTEFRILLPLRHVRLNERRA